MKKNLFILLFFTLYAIRYTLYAPPTYATVDPLSVPNNKFGIHIISAVPDEASDSASLVNSSGGDWGYVTFLIESKDRDVPRWQNFFNYLRQKHLIPIVRLATQPQQGYWKRPYEGEQTAWSDFLDSLNWPVKNRYIIIYNEPNHATEWGNTVDASNYAQTLNKTIDALKEKSSDFFVLNAGFDASSPQKPPAYQEEINYMKQMDEEVPGIFNKLDGWVSHSYPNPGFTGSPDASGRGTVRTWQWELENLNNFGVRKKLPVFITETGWRHSEGKVYNSSLPSSEKVGNYFKNSFNSAWNSNQIVAVTPFLLNYQDPPFDHFSFKKIINQTDGKQQSAQQDYHFPYYAIKDMPKIKATPIQDYKFKLESGSIYNTLVVGETYNIALSVKNTGQSIWNEYGQIKFVPTQGNELIHPQSLTIPEEIKIEPGSTYTFNLKVKAAKMGVFKVKMNLFHGTTQFDSEPVEFTTEVKSPVSLTVKTSLKWKNDYSGEYILNFAGIVKDKIKNIILSRAGLSDEVEVRSLLPDNSYDFTLQKPFYIPKTIHQSISSGPNTLDFGELQPDIPSAILHPGALWHLLPFSN